MEWEGGGQGGSGFVGDVMLGQASTQFVGDQALRGEGLEGVGHV